jgi:hypothetical protein
VRDERDIEGNETENVRLDTDLGSGMMFVHKDTTCKEAKEKEDTCSGLGKTLVHKAGIDDQKHGPSAIYLRAGPGRGLEEGNVSSAYRFY